MCAIAASGKSPRKLLGQQKVHQKRCNSVPSLSKGFCQLVVYENENKLITYKFPLASIEFYHFQFCDQLCRWKTLVPVPHWIRRHSLQGARHLHPAITMCHVSFCRLAYSCWHGITPVSVVSIYCVYCKYSLCTHITHANRSHSAEGTPSSMRGCFLLIWEYSISFYFIYAFFLVSF